MAITRHPVELLAQVRTVLLVDWPNPDVPGSLARAGRRVFVKGGPRPDQYTEHHVVADEVVVQQIGHPPDHADLVYSFRPPDELPEIMALAQTVGARVLWMDPTVPLSPEDDVHARSMAESAGLQYVTGLDIVDEIRRIDAVS